MDVTDDDGNPLGVCLWMLIALLVWALLFAVWAWPL